MKSSGENDISYADDQELVDQFITWTADAVIELRQIVDDISGPLPRRNDSLDRLYDLTHNIKGMGSSFNFSLLTNVGTSLCTYMKNRGDDDLVSKRVLEAHVRTFEVVLEHRITGDGGPKGVALEARLGAIIDEEAA